MVVTTQKGNEKYLQCTIHAEWDNQGNIVAIVGVLQDITKLKMVENSLAETNIYLNTMLDSTEYAVINVDAKGVIEKMNKKALDMLEYEADEVEGKLTPIVFHDPNFLLSEAERLSTELKKKITPDLEVFHCRAKMGLKNDFYVDFISKTGKRIPVFLTVSAIRNNNGEITNYVGFSRNVTDLNEAQKAFIQQKSLLESVINNIPFDFWARDKHHNLIMQNEESKKFWGDSHGVRPEDWSISEKTKNHWLENNTKALAGETVNAEYEYEHLGKKCFVQEIVAPIKSGDEIVGVLGFNIDITERKLNEIKLQDALEEAKKLNEILTEREEELTTKEEELRQSVEELTSVNEFIQEREKQISAIFDNTPDLILSIDKNFRITTANQSFRKLYLNDTGTELQLGSDVLKIFNNLKEREEYKKIYERVLKGETINQISDNINERHGRFISDEYYSPITNEYGEVTGVAIFIKDITEKALQEEQIKAQGRRLLSVANSVTLSNIMVFDANRTLVICNKRYAEAMRDTYGFEVKPGFHGAFDLLPKHFHETYQKHFEKAFNGEMVVFNNMHPSPEPDKFVFTEEVFYPCFNEKNEVEEVAVFVANITDRVMAAQKVQKSEEMLKLAQKIAKVGSWVFNVKKQTFEWSDNMYHLFGISADTALNSDSIAALFSAEEWDKINIAIQHAIDNKADFEVINKYMHPDGQERIFIGNGFAVTDTQGEVVFVYGATKDITDIKLAERKLAESELKFRLISEVSNDALWDTDLVADRVTWSDGYKILYGEPPDADYPNRMWEESILEEDKPRVLEKFNQWLNNPTQAEWEDEYRIKCTDGSTKYILDKGTAIRNAQGKAVRIMGGMRDVTELKISQIKLAESEEKFRLIARTTLDASYDYTVSTGEITWSGTFTKLYELDDHYTPFDIHLWEQQIHPEDRKRVLDSLNYAIEQHECTEWQEEYKIITAKGNTKFVIDKAAFIRNAKGEVVSMLGGMKDVTMLYEKEQALKQALELQKELYQNLQKRELELIDSEQKLTSLLKEISDNQAQLTSIINSTNDYILLIDNELNIKVANQSFRDLLKNNQGIHNVEGLPIFSVMLEEEIQQYNDILPKLKNGEKTHWEKFIKERNVYREEFLNPILDANGNFLGFSAFLRDVTERVKANEKIRENEEILRLSQQVAKVGSWKYEFEDLKMTWSSETYKIFGVSEKEFDLTMENFMSILSSDAVALHQNVAFKAMENHQPYTIEYYHTTPDGEVKYLYGIGKPLTDDKGIIYGYFGSIQDVTERKNIENVLTDSLEEAQKLNEILAQREEELTANEEEMRTYVEELSFTNKKLEQREQFLKITQEIAKLGSFNLDIAAGSVECSDEAYRIFEIPALPAIEYDFFIKLINIHPWIQQYNNETQWNNLSKKEYRAEIAYTTPSKKIKYITVLGVPVVDSNNNLKAVLGSIQDITRLREYQAKIEESENRLRKIFYSDAIGMIFWRNDLRVLEANDYLLNLIGCSRKKMDNGNLHLFDFTKEWINNSNKEEFFNVLKSGRNVTSEEWFINSNGNAIPVETTSGLLDTDFTYGFTLIKDISERKKSEQLLRESQTNLKSIIDNTEFGIWAINKSYELIAFNESFRKGYLQRYYIEPYIGMSIINEHVHPDTLRTYLGLYKEAFRDVRFSKELEDEGENFEVFLSPIKEADGDIRGVAIFNQNITKRKQIENQIKESENLLNSIIENIPIGMMIMHPDGEVIRLNSALVNIVGVPENWPELGGINMMNSPFLKQAGVYDIFKKVSKGGIIVNQEIEIDFGQASNEWNLRDDTVWFSITAFPIYEQRKIKVIVAAITDITQEKKNQERINQSKLELIDTHKKMAEYKLMALRSVMNPHFLFNSLNSIQYFIAKNEREQALNYLSLFSKLIRLILNSSVNNSHTLNDEISILKFYVDLEMLRFENKFKTEFYIDDELDLEGIEIPSLILQPYVENAILHGLYNKSTPDGLLSISFTLTDNEQLLVTVEDNGVGREMAKQIKSANQMHRSVGMLVTQERLELINNNNDLSVKITDKIHPDGTPAGTKVEVLFNI